MLPGETGEQSDFLESARGCDGEIKGGHGDGLPRRMSGFHLGEIGGDDE